MIVARGRNARAERTTTVTALRLSRRRRTSSRPWSPATYYDKHLVIGHRRRTRERLAHRNRCAEIGTPW